MTYFGFLTFFILIPILALTIFIIRGKRKGEFKSNPKFGFALGVHILLALIYTTPWDNYLVATRVWYYNPNLVSGIVLGFVPLEEYTFFVLETLLTSLLWNILANRISASEHFTPSGRFRLASVGVALMVWLAAAFVFLSHSKRLTYLSIILFWALPAIIPQLAFGADILWRQRKLLIWAILPMGLYLSIADSFAITSGTWTIDPAQSIGVFIGSLPLEEAVFFFITVALVSFGVTLLLAEESQLRWLKIKKTFKRSFARMSDC
jgi:lycopene cyclase domain-containing protein